MIKAPSAFSNGGLYPKSGSHTHTISHFSLCVCSVNFFISIVFYINCQKQKANKKKQSILDCRQAVLVLARLYLVGNLAAQVLKQQPKVQPLKLLPAQHLSVNTLKGLIGSWGGGGSIGGQYVGYSRLHFSPES